MTVLLSRECVSLCWKLLESNKFDHSFEADLETL